MGIIDQFVNKSEPRRKRSVAIVLIASLLISLVQPAVYGENSRGFVFSDQQLDVPEAIHGAADLTLTGREENGEKTLLPKGTVITSTSADGKSVSEMIIDEEIKLKEGQVLSTAGLRPQFNLETQPYIEKIDADYDNSLIVSEDGHVYSFGSDDDDQLGIGGQGDQSIPHRINTMSEVESASVGEDHSLVLTEGGHVYSFGRNSLGRTGIGEEEGRQSTPERISGDLKDEHAIQIAATSDHNLVVTDEKEVVSFGRAAEGAGYLGHGEDHGNQLVPKTMSILDKIQVDRVDAGSHSSFVLSEDGNVYSFGRGLGGRLGTGGMDNKYKPTLIGGEEVVSAMSVGHSHSMLLTEDQEVFSFGLSGDGQLGYDVTYSQNEPRKIDDLDGMAVTDIAAGYYHSLVLTGDGDVYSFGKGDAGQLGHGDTKSTYIPTKIEELTDKTVTAISAGDSHSLALTDEGVVYAFGSGDATGLGDGVNEQLTPTPIEEFGEFKEVEITYDLNGESADELYVFPGGALEVKTENGTLAPHVDVTVDLFIPSIQFKDDYVSGESTADPVTFELIYEENEKVETEAFWYRLDDGEGWSDWEAYKGPVEISEVGETSIEAGILDDEDNPETIDSAEAVIEMSDLFAGGDGSDRDPYEIETWEQLDNIRGQHLDDHFILNTDLGEGAPDYDEVVNGDFEPIGDGDGPFTGTFDGNGFSIHDVVIDSDLEYAGLFGAISSTSEIRNVELANVEIEAVDETNTGVDEDRILARVGALVGSSDGGTITNSNTSGVIAGGHFTGGLVGYHDEGEINKSSSSVEISDGYIAGGLVGYSDNGGIMDAHASGDVFGSNRAGGLVGSNEGGGTIMDSSATGDVSTNGENAGGLAGINRESTIETSFATGLVESESGRPRGNIGGLVGLNVESSIEQSYATGDVSGTSSIGGLVGSAGFPDEFQGPMDGGIISKSYATGDVTGNIRTGGLVGQVIHGTEINRSFAFNSEINCNDSCGRVAGLVLDDVTLAGNFALDTQEPIASEDGSSTGQDQADGEDVTAEKAKTKLPYTAEAVEWDFMNTWGINPEVNEGLPFLQWQGHDITYLLETKANPSTGGEVNVFGMNEAGENVEIRASVDSSYRFDRWTLDGDELSTDNPLTYTMPSEDVAIVAEFVETATVTFDSNGGSEVDSITTDVDTTIEEPTAPTLTGYTFEGWYQDDDFEEAWDFESGTVPEDGVTLNAEWAINTYEVTFLDYDATELGVHQVNHGGDAEAPTDPTRTGYTFTGWDPADFTNNTEDLTVTAQYDPSEYTVDFNSNGGTDVDPVEGEFGSTIEEPTEPTRTGYTFEGWYQDDDDFEEAWDFASNTVPAENETLYANWAINTYEVTFTDYDNTELSVEQVNHGDDAIAPSAPSREGHFFTGWEPEDMTDITEDLIFTAQYELKEYTVAFNSNGGTMVEAVEAGFGTTIDEPIEPDRPGFIFKGWYLDENGGDAWEFEADTVPKEGVTLHAKWQADFVDTGDHWANERISELANLGAIDGYSDRTFKPDNQITRAEFVKVIVLATDLDMAGTKIFRDTRDHWASDYIAAAYRNGIIQGYDQTLFGPDDPITREQMGIIITNAFDIPEGEGKDFADREAISPRALDAVWRASNVGILNGYGDGTFRPRNHTTRGEAATVIVRAIENQ